MADKNKTSISHAETAAEIGEFWDTHSFVDYLDETYEVDIEVRAAPKRRVFLDPDVYERIEKKAHSRGLLPETLINLWLLERLQQG